MNLGDLPVMQLHSSPKPEMKEEDRASKFNTVVALSIQQSIQILISIALLKSSPKNNNPLTPIKLVRRQNNVVHCWLHSCTNKISLRNSFDTSIRVRGTSSGAQDHGYLGFSLVLQICKFPFKINICCLYNSNCNENGNKHI